jgi:hypothetical protein
VFAPQEESVGNARQQISPVAEHVTGVRRPAPQAEHLRSGAPRAYGGNQAALRRFAFNSQLIQCKLEVGATNDPLEAEADQVADRVMRMTEPPAPTVQTGPGMVRRMCAGCQKELDNEGQLQRKADPTVIRRLCTECQKDEEKKRPDVQRRAAGVSDGGGPAPDLVRKVLASSGEPLSGSSRAFFGPRFGLDLTDVRVHVDPQAGDSAEQIGARAYTAGSHIVFGHGYSPANNPSLLAHELAHVAQQTPHRQDAPLRRQSGESTGGTGGGSARRPVYVCTKPILGSALHGQGHAFFRVGGPGPGNPTYELEHARSCFCGWQGWPRRDVPEDRDANVPCNLTPINETVLASQWNAYPVGKYCARGPNSNTYVRVVGAACGSTVRPPGSVLGYDDAPPPAGGAGAPHPYLQAITGCMDVDCDDTECGIIPGINSGVVPGQDPEAPPVQRSPETQSPTIIRRLSAGDPTQEKPRPAPRVGATGNLAALGVSHTRPQIQRACRTGAECAAPIPGDTGRNSEEAAKQEEAKKLASGGAASRGEPLCKAARHKERAVNIKKLAEQNGASLPSNFAGIFVNGCLEDISDGELVRCSQMSGGAPVGAGPDQFCIGVSSAREDEAAALLKRNPRSDKENNRATDITSIVTHEVQHAKFEEKAGTIVLPGADCNLKTVIFHSSLPSPTGTDSTVSDYLSEISAEIAEFAPYFKANKDRPGTGAEKHMEDEETHVVESKGESIRGNIMAMQCKCECATVDKWVESVFKDTTGAWAPAQREEFKRAMTSRMPAVWPKSLQTS